MNEPSWNAESLRLTIFLDGLPDTERKWWSELTGEQPSARNQNPRLNALHEEGLFGPGKLIIEAQPTRTCCSPMEHLIRGQTLAFRRLAHSRRP